jgi:hypothetical protein
MTQHPDKFDHGTPNLQSGWVDEVGWTRVGIDVSIYTVIKFDRVLSNKPMGAYAEISSAIEIQSYRLSVVLAASKLRCVRVNCAARLCSAERFVYILRDGAPC